MLPDPEVVHIVFINFASPDHELIEIVDVIDRRDLSARKLLTVLMGQRLQLEQRTVHAAFGS